MRTVLLLTLILSPMGNIFGQTFGLGDDSAVEVAAPSIVETFGLTSAPAPVVTKKVVQPTKTLVVYEPAPAKTVVRTTTRYTSPPGYHRHVLTNGTIIEHHDSNFGDPVAHSGVAGAGWPKYYGPLSPTYVDAGAVIQTQSNCPGGVCPTVTVGRPRLFRRW